MAHKFSELKKAAGRYNAAPEDHRLAVLGDSSTQMLSTAITGMGVLSGMPLNVFDADYDQIKFQVFDDDSELYAFRPDSVLIFMCTQKLFEEYCSYDGDKGTFADEKISELSQIYERIYSKTGASVIELTYVIENDCIFGNFGLKLRSSFVYQLYRLNMLLMELAAEKSYLYLVDTNNMRNIAGEKSFIDNKLYCTSKLAVSLKAIPLIADNVVSVIKSLKGIHKKCIICDLDNTLWGGVIGDDGIDNIQLGELGAGQAYTEFQMWLRELRRRGIIICICSKNNEDTAKEVFLKHPDMILRMEDIAVFAANWEDKASNIKNIREILNIGMDSMVFIDDNPFERELVRKLIPDITVPEMPEDASLFCEYLKSLDLFEISSFSENDVKRTEQYRSEFKRIRLMSNANDIEEYLKDLEMYAKQGSFNSRYCSRIAQLTQRSNQFNLRTVRYSEADIERIANDDKYITRYYTLKDRFGSYGLVAVLILEKREDHLFADTLLMSCRVLKRGMEEYIFNDMVQLAKDNNYECIEAEYIPTKKNKQVEGLYKKFGFHEKEQDKYFINTYEYKDHKTYVNKYEEKEV